MRILLLARSSRLITTAFGPFIALLSQDGANQADQRGSAGEDADDVGTPADLFVQSLLGIVGPDLAPGRCLLRWLDRYRVEMAGLEKIAEMVPDHCTASVAKLARGYARLGSGMN
jgi:hypothetical protein